MGMALTIKTILQPFIASLEKSNSSIIFLWWHPIHAQNFASAEA
jgi:hypothetical protein